MTRTIGGAGSGYSRREFLRGTSAAAAATAMATGATALAEEQAKGDGVVREATSITLDVNGKAHKVRVEPRTTLLDVLRNQLDLTGAKPVSGDASSGAATVLINDKPACAASTLAMQAVGKKIRTVESLGGHKLDGVCSAFAHEDAEQCGFCTPGFVMAVRGFLDAHPKASDAEIRAGLNGNICRCGTYTNIIRAAIHVVRGG